MKRFFAIALLIMIILPIYPLEKEASDWDMLCMYYNQKTPFNVTTAALIEGVIDNDILHAALRIIQQRHPMLQCKVVFDNKNHALITTQGVGEIPCIIVERLSDNQWQEVMTQDITQSFEIEKGPLLRLYYLKGPHQGELVLTFSHLCMDGISRAYFFNELFTLIDDLKNNRPYDINVDKSFITNIERDFLYPKETIPTQSLKKVSYIDTSSFKTCFIPYTFSEQETKKIQERYRNNKSSLQSLLMSAAAVVTANKIQSKTETDSCDFFFYLPLNIRPYFKEPLSVNDLGNWISIVSFNHNVSQNTLVDELSKEIKNKMSHELNQGSHLALIHGSSTFIKACDFDAETIAAYFQKRTPTITVSQIGTLPFITTYGDVKFKTLYGGLFDYKGQVVHPDSCVVAGAILNGQLSILFIYVEPLTSYAQAQERFDLFKAKLLE